VSPIHDQGYRRYGGSRAALGRAWAVIAKAGVRTMLGRRAFIALLLLSWLPFFVRAVQIYAAANVPQASFLAPDPQMFRQFLEQQEPFLFFITVYAGAGLIANDRRANALQIYLSKPLTRAEYVFGKLAVLLTFLLLTNWVPAVVLLIVQIMFSGSFTFVLNNLSLFPSITLFAFIQAIAMSMAMLALSSLSRSSRYVGILYAAVNFFSEAVFGVLFVITRSRYMAGVSMPRNLAAIGDVVFRLPSGRQNAPALEAFVIIALLIAASALILERRVRGVEVVA
jgi:ABC-2 type transport system permease protein